MIKEPGDIPNAGPPLDNLQQLLQRRAELAKNKAKYTLTEVDANLLCSHSTEVHFEDGQTIAEELQDISSVYRIKSGKVSLSRNGVAFFELTKGWFIGDTVLLTNKPAVIRLTMKTVGPVVLTELNTAFVKKLFDIDTILSVKFLRHLASKNASIFFQILGNLMHPSLHPPGSPTYDSFYAIPSPSLLVTSTTTTTTTTTDVLDSPTSASPRPRGLSTAPVEGSPQASPASAGVSIAAMSSSSRSSGNFAAPVSKNTNDVNDVDQRLRNTKRQQRALEHVAYKTYPLVSNGSGVQSLRLKTKKIAVNTKSFGFKFKTSIPLDKIITISPAGEQGVTINYHPKKTTTITFKTPQEREEFMGLMTSLTAPKPPSPAVAGGHITSPHIREESEEPLSNNAAASANEEEFYRSLQTRLDLKKGDVVFAEGDLYQRVYTVVSGHCDVIQEGKVVSSMEEGEIFYAGSLLHLRPAPVTIVVASDEAQIQLIPAYKINGLIETNAALAQRLFRKAALVLEGELAKLLAYQPSKRVLEARQAALKSSETVQVSAEVSQG